MWIVAYKQLNLPPPTNLFKVAYLRTPRHWHWPWPRSHPPSHTGTPLDLFKLALYVARTSTLYQQMANWPLTERPSYAYR